jgi:heterodisulfide reductase subunit C
LPNLSDQQVYEAIAEIIEEFDIFECLECARAILEWVRRNNVEGVVLKLRTRYRDEDFIISRRLERRGIAESVTANGIHYGVEVRGLVFDNLSLDGMTQTEWINDFSCPSDQFTVEELDEV